MKNRKPQKPDPQSVSTEAGLAATTRYPSGRPVGGETFLLTSPFIERLPLVIINHGHRQQCSVPNEKGWIIVTILKKCIPRRTILRGAGAALALPVLDAMFPALASAAQTGSGRPTRLSFFTVPNGIIMEKWTPAASGSGV